MQAGADGLAVVTGAELRSGGRLALGADKLDPEPLHAEYRDTVARVSRHHGRHCGMTVCGVPHGCAVVNNPKL